MRRLLILLCCLSVLAGCSRSNKAPGAAGGSPEESPSAVQTTTNRPTGSAMPKFSGAEAFSFLKAQTAFGPRNPGSMGHGACLQYLAGTLAPLADTLWLQRFHHDGYDGESFSLTNVIASFNVKAASRILLCAHWDTRPRAENDPDKSRRNEPILGANDGASGVAVLLEVGRLLKSTPPSIGVDIALFDGEDYGKEGDHQSYFLGARYFASAKQASYNPRFGILLDMVGDKFLDLPKEQYSVQYAPDVVDLVWNAAASLGIGQFQDEPGEEVLDDHIPLNEAGIKTIDIIDFNYPDPTNRFWHSHQDTPENCSAESLEAVGTVITKVVYSQLP
ncbi:MAG TPA: M28 family peptidase [Bacteroidota bacterium]|nr:M28 family peptidase [Bacteroidota bacterium]